MSADYSSLPTSTKDYVLPAKKLHPADESFLAAIPLSLARRRSIGERGVTGGLSLISSIISGPLAGKGERKLTAVRHIPPMGEIRREQVKNICIS